MAAMQSLCEITDLFESTAGAGRVDRERGLIRRVKVLGWTSANGYSYDPAGVSASLYEGKVVNLGHGSSGMDRAPADRFGRLVNARKDEHGIWADLEYLRSDPLAGKIAEAAERMPGLFGLSHVVDRGDYRRGKRGETVVIEAVDRVRCVDLVSDPATTRGLLESRRVPSMNGTLADLVEAVKAHPQCPAALTEQMDALLPAPEPQEATASGDSGSDDAMRAPMHQLVDR